MHYREHIQSLHTETFDLCIIGGGSAGAGCALDAALRGLKVVLIDSDDFAAATSSKSTKLIHGGVRYLEQAFKKLDFGQLKQVRHGLEERYTVIQNAPFLARPLAILTPCYNWWEGLYYSIGLRLYDWFSGGDPLPKSRWLSKKRSLELIRGLSPRHVHSSVLYYDGQLDDARYCLLLAKTAAEKGAVVANHVALEGFEKDAEGRIASARLHDHLTDKHFTLRARVFLNCAGPAADPVRWMANADLEPRLRQSKGVHAMLPLAVLGSNETALLIPKTSDGRVIFAIPWENHLLLGTTDTPWDAPADQEPLLESVEVDFLLENLNRYVDQPADKTQVLAGFGGLRPLLSPGKQAGKETKSLVRDHEIETDPASGLISLLGGKWTTYRLMAQDAVDAVCRNLGVQAPCQTKDQLLAGAEGYHPDYWQSLLTQYPGLSETACRHLAQKYGSRATLIAKLATETPGLAAPLVEGQPFLRAEVLYAVRQEMACTLRDVLARRMRLEATDWQATLKAMEPTAALMAAELGWSVEEKNSHVSSYRAQIEQFIQHAQI